MEHLYRRPLVQMLASLITAMENSSKSGNNEWHVRYSQRLSYLENNLLPSGSGLDSGTQILIEKCKPNMLVFQTSFHHMNETGYYDGWTDHIVRVTAAFDGFDVSVSGRNRNFVKDHIADVFRHTLQQLVELDHEKDTYRMVRS